MPINGQYLKWFHQIEKALWSFFALFGDLCGSCARQTQEDFAAGRRKGRDSWCCCMIDNQVHDNWESLDAVQKRFEPQWYEAMRRPRGVRTFGNGPCPALSDQGCRLKKCRPITCTTQVCSKMLVILKDLGVIQKPTHTALQIEDLFAVPDILPDLYGTRKDRKVRRQDVETYLAEVKRATGKFAKAMVRQVEAPGPGPAPDDAHGNSTTKDPEVEQSSLQGAAQRGLRPQPKREVT